MTSGVPVRENAVSVTTALARATFPVLVTRNEYVTFSPALAMVIGFADLTRSILGAGVAVSVPTLRLSYLTAALEAVAERPHGHNRRCGHLGQRRGGL